MNELELYLDDQADERPGYATLQTRPEFPGHGDFNPGGAVGLGYEDLMTIEVHEFLKGVANGMPAVPDFGQIGRVANVQAAMARSWQSRTWETVVEG